MSRLFIPAVLLSLLACQSEPPSEPSEVNMTSVRNEASHVSFVEVSSELGLDWQHDNGASVHKFFPETMSGGGAFVDFDGDGDLDIYALNGGPLDSAPSARPPNALFRNDGRFFSSVTDAAGAADRSYSMGIAAGDIDGDGDLDLYLANYGPNVLLRNDESRFIDISRVSATDDNLWGSSCAFADYDLDGDLDLYVANYVHYDLADADRDNTPYMSNAEAYEGNTAKGYPHPANFPGSPDRLYRNDGTGHFIEVAHQAGIYDEGGKGLGVVFADYDSDGWPDVYVANDAVRNFLYRNGRDGTFVEGAALSGVAYGQDGQMEAGMGVDWGDYDGDAQLDLTVTNFQAEPNALYHNEGNQFFSIETFTSGTGMITLPYLGFGTQFIDYDHDGDLDLFTANGHVLDNIEQVDRSTQYPQRNLLFRNDGSATGRVRFSEVGLEVGLIQERVSRGTASGDYDNDGDPDLLVFNTGQKLALYRNDNNDPSARWLWISLRSQQANSHGIGARLILSTKDRRQVREVRGSRSYLSQSDLRVHFGLGKNQWAEWLDIYWPSGVKERFVDLQSNQFLSLREGSGQPIP
jgi:hypothetical protein